MLQFDDNFKKIQEQVKWIEGNAGKKLKRIILLLLSMVFSMAFCPSARNHHCIGSGIKHH
jgi:hypothetical protein